MLSDQSIIKIKEMVVCVPEGLGGGVLGRVCNSSLGNSQPLRGQIIGEIFVFTPAYPEQ